MAVLAAMAGALRDLPAAGDDAARVDQIRLLEELKSVAAAVQVRVTAEFVGSQRRENVAVGVPVARAERGVAAQVALARRVSPFQAQRYVGWVKILMGELPETFAALRAGRTSEWRAMLVARETAWLSRKHRALVDRELAPQLAGLGDRRVVGEARRSAYRLDPDGYVDRLRNVEAERRVTLRPAPDAMARLTALLPVVQGVAAYAALCAHADGAFAAGEKRSRGQVMADTLVERVTGQAAAEAVPVEVNLVMPAETLLDPDGREPAVLSGAGAVPAPIPARIARDVVLNPKRTAPVWLRRLFALPSSGELIAMESKRRRFTKAQRKFVRLRDEICSTPWCDAPIRHVDHVVPVVAGGSTSLANAGGLCEACNYAKQAPGWRARPGPGGVVTLTTPTGHRYRSSPPRPPGAERRLVS